MSAVYLLYTCTHLSADNRDVEDMSLRIMRQV